MAVNNLGPIRINYTGPFSQDRDYKFLDAVKYNGSTYVAINKDYITETFRGISPDPEIDDAAELYWYLEAEKGEQGPMADKYDSFITLEDTGTEIVWDYAVSDKVIVPTDMDFSDKILDIQNVYDGCCGMILTRNKNIRLPENSDYALDFDYINVGVKQYYMYTFVYCAMPVLIPEEHTSYRFVWNRTVIQGVEDLE